MFASARIAPDSKGLSFRVKLVTLLREFPGLLFHAAFEGFFLAHALFGGVFADVFGDLHRTEMRAAHGAEVRGVRAVLREGFVVEFPRGDGVEAEVGSALRFGADVSW